MQDNDHRASVGRGRGMADQGTSGVCRSRDFWGLQIKGLLGSAEICWLGRSRERIGSQIRSVGAGNRLDPGFVR
jgi:hypothetical protein